MPIIFKAYKSDEWRGSEQFCAADPQDIANAKQEIRSEFSMVERASMATVESLDKDLRGLESSLTEHQAKAVERLEHSLAAQASALALAETAAREEFARLQEGMAKACDAFGMTEHRLRRAIENGEWRGLFVAQVERTVGELDRMVKVAHEGMDRGIQAIQDGVVGLQVTEASIRSILYIHEGTVAALLDERGNEFRQKCQGLLTQAQQQAASASTARELASCLASQVREDLGKVLEAAREVERGCRALQEHRHETAFEMAGLALAAVARSAESVKW